MSEGRRPDVVAALAAAAGACLLDVHTDAAHHRAVLTLAGGPSVEAAVRAVATEAVRSIDVGDHAGAHPRLGAIDVVPFVPLAATSLDQAIAARDRFAHWAGAELALPCFLYGPGRSLPEVRRRAFVDLSPDVGPRAPHPTAGATCVGARAVMIAYNVWLAPGAGVAEARAVAAAVRGPAVRALGLDLGGRFQVSMNLLDPDLVGPERAFDAVAALVPVAGAELVGLLPQSVLASVPERRWAELDLGPDRTIEARLDGR